MEILTQFRDILAMLGMDIEGFFISLLAFAIVVGIVYFARLLHLDSIYNRYKDQLDIIEKYAPDVFIRIAFPDIAGEELDITLKLYEEQAQTRVESGLSWIDPRMLYAIDRVEESLPEGYKMDLNVVIDKMETIYQKMKAEGFFAEQ